MNQCVSILLVISLSRQNKQPGTVLEVLTTGWIFLYHIRDVPENSVVVICLQVVPEHHAEQSVNQVYLFLLQATIHEFIGQIGKEKAIQ